MKTEIILAMITLELIAQELNGKLYQKDNIGRVYIKRGFNTDKVTTTTYIYLDHNNTPQIRCWVECKVQPVKWCLSQSYKVAESVFSELKNIGKAKLKKQTKKYEITEIKPIKKYTPICDQIRKLQTHN